MSLKIVFAGTPQFAVPALDALICSQHSVVAVYTQPDRPSGRGRKITQSPIKQLAEQHQIKVFQPKTLKDPEAQKELADLEPDVMIVAAYGLILPEKVLSIPRLGCINIHASLLPRWRGATPIQQAILAGDEKTGITIMQMDTGVDTGDILLQKACNILPQDTSQDLHDRLAILGGETLLQALANLEKGSISSNVQDEKLATHAPKINKADAEIDWNKTAIELERQVRAFVPAPIAYTTFNKKLLRIWRAKALANSTQLPPGTLIKADKMGVEVATSEGILQLLVVQLQGGKPMSAGDFLNANKEALVPNKTKFGG